MRNRLEWTVLPMGEIEARDGDYRFLIWNYGKKEGSELRFYRYDRIANGIGVPFFDFSIRVAGESEAKRLAGVLNREFRKARRYNGPVNL